MESAEVAPRGLVVAGGDASPCLHPVDRPLDGVPLLVELGVVTDGPTASTALTKDRSTSPRFAASAIRPSSRA